MFVIYFGIQKDGMNYQRIEYGLMKLVSNAGGFIHAVHKGWMMVIYLVCAMNVKA